MGTSPIQTVELSGVEPLQLGPGVCPATSGTAKQVVSNKAPEATDDQTKQSKSIQLQERVQRGEILEGIDALDFLRYLRSSPLPAPAEKQINIQSLEQDLRRHIPRDKQLTRRARKVAWQIAKGRQLDCDWDYIFLSELTPTEKMLSDEDFLALHSHKVKSRAKRGGRPRKYSTRAEEKKGHAECQRRHRERKSPVVSNVTKKPPCRSLITQ